MFGNACSIIVVCYLSANAIRCAFNVGKLILNDRLPVPEALRFSVGLTDLIQRRLVAERRQHAAVVWYDPQQGTALLPGSDTSSDTDKVDQPQPFAVPDPDVNPPLYPGLNQGYVPINRRF